jgi:hypothetical protein
MHLPIEILSVILSYNLCDKLFILLTDNEKEECLKHFKNNNINIATAKFILKEFKVSEEFAAKLIRNYPTL